MAHYRSSLFLFTCIACLSTSVIPTSESGQHALNLSYSAFAQETAPVESPSDDRPEPNPKKTSPAPKKSKSNQSATQKSNSKIPQPIANLMVILSRQRGLLMLSMAAVVITVAAVFIMLKLVGNDESNNYKRRQKKLDQNRAKNSEATNPNSQTIFTKVQQQGVDFEQGATQPSLPYSFDFSKIHSHESSDRLLPFIVEPDEVESEERVVKKDDRDAPDALPLESHTNGNSDTGLKIPEKHPWIDSSVSRSQEIALPEPPKQPKLDIIEALIEDLRHLSSVKRRKAIWELGQQGDSRAVEPLLDLLTNSDSQQYSLILASLSEIGIRTIKPMNNAWSISMQNENPEVRKNAIRDLTRIYELVNQISYLLHHATDDPDPEVQETARWAINQLNRIRPRSTRDN
jgi:hypothetical protein